MWYLLGTLVIAVLIGVIRYQAQVIAARDAALAKREKRKESKIATLRDQNSYLDQRLSDETSKRMNAEFKLYAMSKDTITITPYNTLDVNKLVTLLHEIVPRNGAYGHRNNMQGLMEWLYGKERKQWPADLQYPAIGHDTVLWQGSVIHPPQQLQQVVYQLEQFHNQKQGVSANGHQ